MVLDASKEREDIDDVRSTSGSKDKSINVEESPKGNPTSKRRVNTKRRNIDDDNYDVESVDNDPTPQRKSARRSKAKPDTPEESGEDKEDDDENVSNNDNEVTDDIDIESISSEDYQYINDSSVSDVPKRRRDKSPPRHGKKISTRKKIQIPSKTSKMSSKKESSTEKSKKTSSSLKSKPKAPKAKSTSSKSSKTERTSNRKRKLDEISDDEPDEDDESV